MNAPAKHSQFYLLYVKVVYELASLVLRTFLFAWLLRCHVWKSHRTCMTSRLVSYKLQGWILWRRHVRVLERKNCSGRWPSFQLRPPNRFTCIATEYNYRDMQFWHGHNHIPHIQFKKRRPEVYNLQQGSNSMCVIKNGTRERKLFGLFCQIDSRT